jgi:hypothetical protein
MKRFAIPMLAGFLAAALVTVAQAEDREVTVKGDLQCGKCSAKVSRGCETILTVKEGDKTVTYFLAKNELRKPYDAKTCGGEKIPATVTGTVAEKDGKKELTAKKISEDKS